MAYLREEAPRWYLYVTRPDYSIEPSEPGDERSRARGSESRVFIHEDTFVSPMRLARALVHESCHIHQHAENRWPSVTYAAVRAEQECVSRELEMVVNIDPEHCYVQELGNKLASPYEWWESEAV